jgi:hypothetical protein
MAKQENLDNQENVQETPEQEETSRQLQKMARNLEEGKNESGVPNMLEEINKRLSELEIRESSGRSLKLHEQDEYNSLVHQKAALMEAELRRQQQK